MSHEDATETVAKALDDLDRAFVAVTDAVTADPDLERAFALMTRWTEALRLTTNSSAEVRRKIITNLKERDGLSLAALGKKVGISKALAEQLTKSPKSPKPPSEGTEQS
ncbi:hypothetical protein GCM10010404_85830 [Nonomuraea africana]|uniref:Transcriptional regulator n=1 Tax=Nonomuraea africana TaxID=46171 RepID=A0ABR9K892_9ACTN|nr:hypothetical protein [Nonomuraea africana]MBE1558228.1 hypothetical protein [Nonomuraea africana]